jgi:catechol 2,3-dioxygenase-like lactoylglutathione lyase family enzyme
MQPRVTVLTLGVEDLPRARRFYADGLGWKPAKGSDESVVFFNLNGLVLSLFPRTALAEDANIPAAGSGFGGITIAHNVASKAEVDAVLADAQRAGAKLLRPGSDAFWGGYTGYFADPEGFVWEVAWNPFWTLTPDGQMRIED